MARCVGPDNSPDRGHGFREILIIRLDQFSFVAFLKVAEARSFIRAAAALGVAPASLSEAVKGLEDRLGGRLLDRTTRSVGLTEAGAAYFERVRPAAGELQAAGSALREARDHPAGTLRLICPGSQVRSWSSP